MKITKQQLKKIIQEEAQIALNEDEVEESFDINAPYYAAYGPAAEFFWTLAAGSLATIFLLSGSMALGLFAKFLINEFGQAGQKAVDAIKNKDEKGWKAAQKQFDMEDSIKESANMKITKQQLKKIIQEEIEATLAEEFGDDAPFRARDMVPPKVRGKFKDTFTKIPNPDLEKRGAERRPDAQEKAAWKAAGGVLSVFDKPTIAQFLEDAGLNISLEKYMDNIKLAVENDRLGRRIVSLVDALALANKTGSRRGHLKTAKKKSQKPPQFTREAVTSMKQKASREY